MPKPYDLTDSDTVKAVMSLPTTGARPNQQTRLDLLISAYSKAVARYTQRQFVGKDPTLGGTLTFDPNATSSKTFNYDGNGYLSFAPWEPREIESVTLDGVTLSLYNPAAPNSEAYDPSPAQKTTEDTFFSLALPRRERMGGSWVGHFGTEYVGTGYSGRVVVVAKWGIVEVDGDVELATCIAVADGFRNPEGAASRGMGEFSMTETPESNGTSLPSAARSLLLPLIRS